jgi:hypothetical protein
MTHRFVVADGPATNLYGSWGRGQRTLPLTFGTGLVIAKAVELIAENLLDGALDDGLPHVDGQGLDGVEVEVEPWTLLAIGTPGHDFSPAVSQIAEFLKIVGLSLDEWHSEFILELGERSKLGKSA